MPTPCNLKVEGYPGSSEKEGREDTSDVFEIEHHIHQPLDPTTGQATGVRVHSPMRVVKVVDKATPGFHKALCTGENLKSAILDFYRIDPATGRASYIDSLGISIDSLAWNGSSLYGISSSTDSLYAIQRRSATASFPAPSSARSRTRPRPRCRRPRPSRRPAAPRASTSPSRRCTDRTARTERSRACWT